MRLEGTLDAFSLPDIFQLLSYTKKTGALHLRRDQQHGVVHLRDGAVTGARSDVGRQALGRRLVGSGLVGDDALADAVEKVLDHPGSGLARAIADGGSIEPELLGRVAAEQATDAVFDLLRWPDGDFAFVVDEADPDDLGAVLPVEDVVAEGRRRIEAWGSLSTAVPQATDVVTLVPLPSAEPVLTLPEWTLVALVDGIRTVTELVALSGTGEYVVVTALADLTARGLLTVGAPATGPSPLQQRQELLAALETGAVPVAPVVAASPVIPERPEPFTAPRQVEHAEEPLLALARFASVTARASATAELAGARPVSAHANGQATSAGAGPRSATGSHASHVGAASAGPAPAGTSSQVGSVSGAHALQLDALPAASTHIDRDPSVNKSLLLRLIAGVRGL